MKKIICLVAVLLSFFTVTCYAGTTLTDIKGTIYEDAVEKLNLFEIVNGFEDNTFKPKDKVTRAQLAKMLVTSMGMQDEVESAKKKYLSFSDVLSSYWGYGYIKVASDQKLVNGYENGTFKPEGSVTYAEATTMVVRALGYEDEIKKINLAWPNNYMSYADEELDLFQSIGTFKGNDYATRGDIALLIWNALRTGVAEIVAENDKGLIYGPGTPMITEYLNYTYIKNADVSDVEFDEEYKEAYVTLTEEGKKKGKRFKFDAEDVLEMYGTKVTVLFDEKNNDVLSLECDTEYRVIEAEVTNITETKIYVANRATGYNIPDEDNILLYGIDFFEDAVEVILLLEGNSVEYCVAKGATEVFAGIVVNDYIEIDDGEYGVKIRKIGAKKGGESYYLANEEDWPEEGTTILYYLNSDDFLAIVEEIDSDYAVEVDRIEKNYIKTSNKKSYEFENEDEYTVVLTGTSKIERGDLSDIDKNVDLVYVTNYNTHSYIFVLVGALEEFLDDELVDALDDLAFIIEDALEEYDEEDYSQESYADLMKEIKKGKSLNYKSTISKIKSAVTSIETAIENLDDSIGRTEKKIVAAKKELRTLVNDECEDILADEEYYTEDTFEYFYECYDEAIYILEITDAKLSEVQDAYDYLVEAIDELEEIDE